LTAISFYGIAYLPNYLILGWRSQSVTKSKEAYGQTYTFLEAGDGLPSRWRSEKGRNRILVIPPFDPSLYPRLPSVPPYDPSESWSVYIPHQEIHEGWVREYGLGPWYEFFGENAKERAFAVAGPFVTQLHSISESEDEEANE
jgi:hypothetical protein